MEMKDNDIDITAQDCCTDIPSPHLSPSRRLPVVLTFNNACHVHLPPRPFTHRLGSNFYRFSAKHVSDELAITALPDTL
jgi:hypothetical protein